MDPGLWELYEGDEDDEVSAIIRLNNPETLPDRIRLVCQFGEIATCRLQRTDIPLVHDDPSVKSLKAPRGLINTEYAEDISSENSEYADYFVQRPDVSETGRGVVIGIIDWGCDFAHPDFIDENGESRLLALWLQKGVTEVTHNNPYGRGRIISRQQINQALATDTPYEALDNHPGEVAPQGGSHGTHTMGIAAGNGYGSDLPGIAPDADLIFVQADSSGLSGLANFGDSVGLLEAVDFILKYAENRPCVINMSMGRHGGPHDGSTLVELGLDSALLHTPGLAIVNSTGNYFNSSTHASGQLETGRQKTLIWIVNAVDKTPNELEVWYSGDDQFTVQLISPDGMQFGPVQLDNRENILINDDLVGRIYHRSNDPNNAKHHIDIFLYTNSPAGEWQVLLKANKVYNGRFDAWIERDVGSRKNQSRFADDDIDHTSTTGTIANGHYTITVGAYDARSPRRELAPFSSSGPTTDNRQKPELVAPGVRVIAASSSPFIADDSPLVVTKSGTSMAAPHVTGTVALMYEAAGHKLPIQEIRQMLFTASEDIAVYSSERYRLGNGFLNATQAVENARRINNLGKEKTTAATHETNNIDIAWNTATFEEEGEMNNFNEYKNSEAELTSPAEDNSELINYIESNAAQVYDNLVYGIHNPYIRSDLNIISYPGEHITQPIRNGDILIRRVLGEGSLAYGSVVDAVDTQTLRNHRMPLDSIIVRAQQYAGFASEDNPRRHRTIIFDDPTQITVPVTRIAGHGLEAGEREIEDLLNSLRASISRYWDNYYQGLNSFETGMQFASDQEMESQYLEIALKEVGKLIIDEIISNTLKQFPVINVIATGIKNIAFAWHEEGKRVARDSGERRIAVYITSIRNEASRPNGPHQQMLRLIDQTRPRLLENFRQAVQQTQIQSQGQHGVLTGEAALFIRQLRESIQNFQNAIPGAAYFTQMFAERFGGSQAWTRRPVQGGRPGGTLYLKMSLYKDRNQWNLRSTASSWEFATTAPNPERLASTLRDALYAQNKKIWQSRLPKMVKMRIEVEESGFNSYQTGNVRFIHDPRRIEIRTNYGPRLFREAWNIPDISRRALNVNNLRGSDD